MENKIGEILEAITELKKETNEKLNDLENKINQRYSEIESEDGDIYLDEKYTSLVREQQEIMKNAENKIQEMNSKIQSIKHQLELENAKKEYLELSREKVAIEREIEKDETTIKESKLFKTRNELEKEIIKLKSLGKTSADSEVREYERDIQLISKELKGIEERIETKRVKLDNVTQRLNELAQNREIIPTTKQVENDNDEEYNDLRSVIKNSRREYDDVYSISYLVSNKGVYYNGLLQDEDELLDYISEDEFDKEMLKILGREKTLKLQEKYDPYIVAAILNNGFDWFGEDQKYIENAKSIRLNKYYNFIVNKKANKDINITYDLRGTSTLLNFFGKNILNREFVKEAKRYAYKSREFADVIVDKITSLKFKMYDILPRRKTETLTIKYGMDEANNSRKNNWKVQESYSTKIQDNKLTKSDKPHLSNIQTDKSR